MCARYNLRSNAHDLSNLFGVDFPALAERFNIAPTQEVPIVRLHGSKEVATVRWGLVPSWSSDAKGGAKLINARSETVAEKPSFRSAFKKRRCLIPADGYFEWKTEGKKKIPFHFHFGKPFAFAGIWESWHDEKESALETCSVLTTAANEIAKPYHERMPVILRSADYDRWLDHSITDVEKLRDIFESKPSTDLQITRVSTVVNNSRVDNPHCIDPDPETTLF